MLSLSLAHAVIDGSFAYTVDSDRWEAGMHDSARWMRLLMLLEEHSSAGSNDLSNKSTGTTTCAGQRRRGAV